MAATQLTFVKPREEHSFKIHVAIDFGTDGMGMAYAIDDQVFVHQKWNSKKYGATVKPKTIVLFDDDEEAIFGMDAKFQLKSPPSKTITNPLTNNHHHIHHHI